MRSSPVPRGRRWAVPEELSSEARFSTVCHSPASAAARIPSCSSVIRRWRRASLFSGDDSAMNLRRTAFDLGNELGRIGGERVCSDNHRSLAGQLGERLRQLGATRHPGTADQDGDDRQPSPERGNQLRTDSVRAAVQSPLPPDVGPLRADDGHDDVCLKGALRLDGIRIANDLEMLGKPLADLLGDVRAVLAPIAQIDARHTTSLHPVRAVR